MCRVIRESFGSKRRASVAGYLQRLHKRRQAAARSNLVSSVAVERQVAQDPRGAVLHLRPVLACADAAAGAVGACGARAAGGPPLRCARSLRRARLRKRAAGLAGGVAAAAGVRRRGGTKWRSRRQAHRRAGRQPRRARPGAAGRRPHCGQRQRLAGRVAWQRGHQLVLLAVQQAQERVRAGRVDKRGAAAAIGRREPLEREHSIGQSARLRCGRRQQLH
jgi:hypothetical protein